MTMAVVAGSPSKKSRFGSTEDGLWTPPARSSTVEREGWRTGSISSASACGPAAVSAGATEHVDNMADYSKRHAFPGFTLIELLVVVAIIALLATLIAPSLRSVIRMMHRATCGNNLRRIGEAATLHAGSDPGGQQVKLSPLRWPLQLSPFVEGSDVFTCPEGDGESQFAQSASLSDLVCINVTTTGYDLEFIEGPFVARLSEEQVQAIDFQTGRRVNAPPYNAGADPTVCWYIFEDVPFQHGDLDYDLGCRVTDNLDGTLTLSMKQLTGAGYNFNLVAKEDRKILVRKSQMDGSPANEVVVGNGSGIASYGLNAGVKNFSDGSGRIMALDYPWFVARSSHDWSGDKLAGEIPGIPIFARHSGQINVLFSGGAVQLMRPDDINPADPGVQRSLWDD